MPSVRLKTRAPLDVEGFPADAERSVKGALRLTSGAPAYVTNDEAAHLGAIGAPVVITPDPAPPRPAPAPVKKTKPAAKPKTTSSKPKKKAKPA
jgi:hypothetical protein